MEIRMPAQRVGKILAGKHIIIADIDLRLCRFVGLSMAGGCACRRTTILR
jgi:hypothetical protein